MKLFFLILILAAVQNISAIENYNPGERPVTDGPVKVKVKIYYFDIEVINDVRQNFSADLIVRLDWVDKRLVNKEGKYKLNEVWHPYLQISNVRDYESRLPELLNVDKEGNVFYRQRFYGTFASKLDFKSFPFDKQVLSLNLLSLPYSENEVEFELEWSGNDERFSITGWTVTPGDVTIEPLTVNLNKGESGGMPLTRAQLIYTMEATRHISYYWYKVLAPMAIIIFLSWAVFYIDPVQVGAQIGVSATSILTLIAFLLRLENILPPISYLTTMDYFVFSALIIVFLAYMEAIVSTSFALQGKTEIALKLDMTSRYLYPVMFALIILFFWIL